MHGGAWRVCRAYSSIQKEVEKRPNFLEMYCPRGEFPSIRDVSISDREMTARTGLFQAAS